MEFRFIFNLLKRNSVFVSISVIFFVSCTTVYSLVTKPVYESTIQLFVSTPVSSLDITSLNVGSDFGSQRVSSYTKLIKSQLVLEPIITQLSLDKDYQSLSSQVSVVNPLNTVLLEVSVRDHDPKIAQDIVNAIGSQLSKVVSQIELGSTDNSGITISQTVEGKFPTSPVLPNKKLNLVIGLVLGFLVGIAISAIRAFLDNKVKNQSHLQGIPLSAAMLFYRDHSSRPLIDHKNPYTAKYEAFTLLRVSILNSIEKLGVVKDVKKKPLAKCKIISIASALPSEGKSTVAANLAIALASKQRRVLLIDADLRRPTIHKLFANDSIRQESEVGLTQFLAGKASIAKIIKKTSFLNLKCIYAGKVGENPNSLITNNLFKKLLNSLRRNYDFIIIDTSPILPTTDGVEVTQSSDGVIIVVKVNSTRIAHYNRVLSLLTEIGINIYGVVLNMIPVESDAEEYGYGYGYGYRYRSQYKYARYSYPANNFHNIDTQGIQGSYIVKNISAGYLPQPSGYSPESVYKPDLDERT